MRIEKTIRKDGITKFEKFFLSFLMNSMCALIGSKQVSGINNNYRLSQF